MISITPSPRRAPTNTGRGWRASIILPALALLCSPAAAETVRAYTPGGAPCAGACSLEWALTQSGAPMGDPQPMIIPTGTVFTGMSYANGGQPYWTERALVLATDEPGVGYAYTAPDGRRRHMVQIDECENWAVAELPPAISARGGDEIASLGPAGGGAGARGAAPLFAAAIGGFSGGVAFRPDGGGRATPISPPPPSPVSPGGPVTPPVPPTFTPPPPSPTPVPLPGALWLLAVGVAILTIWRRL